MKDMCLYCCYSLRLSYFTKHSVNFNIDVFEWKMMNFPLKIIHAHFTLKCLSTTIFLGFRDSYIFHFHVTMLVHTGSEPLPTVVDL
jgi:hypothetical protein